MSLVPEKNSEIRNLVFKLCNIVRCKGIISEDDLRALNIDPVMLNLIKEHFLVRRSNGFYDLNRQKDIVREAFVFLEYLDDFKGEKRVEALKKLRNVCDSLRELKREMESRPHSDNLALIVSIVAYDIMLQEEDVINRTLIDLFREELYKQYDEILRRVLNDWRYKYFLVLSVLACQIKVRVEDVDYLLENARRIPETVESLRLLKKELVTILNCIKSEKFVLPSSLVREIKVSHLLNIRNTDINKVNEALACRLSRLFWDIILEELYEYIDFIKNEELDKLDEFVKDIVLSGLNVDLNKLKEEVN